jgi:uncharacterized protein with PIN domain
MTPKNLMSADLTELDAVDIRCLQCSGSMSIPIPLPRQGLKERLPVVFACPGCGTQFWSGDAGYNAMLAVMSSLSEWRQLKDAKFRMGFTIPAS